MSGLLHQWNAGDRGAYELLAGLVYAELRRLAAHYLRGERPEHTLQPTALVHEAFLRLAGQEETRWQNRDQFFAVAAQMMRRVLVDHARGRGRQKRGGDAVRLSLDAEDDWAIGFDERVHATVQKPVDLIDLDRALEELAQVDPELVRVVELRYFGGLSIEETARATDTSPATVKRAWAVAKAWLHDRLLASG